MMDRRQFAGKCTLLVCVAVLVLLDTAQSASCPANYPEKVDFCKACMRIVRSLEGEVRPVRLHQTVGIENLKRDRKDAYGYIADVFEKVCRITQLATQDMIKPCTYLVEEHDEEFTKWYIERFEKYHADQTYEKSLEGDPETVHIWDELFCKKMHDFCPEGEGDINQEYNSLPPPDPEDNARAEIPVVVLANYNEVVTDNFRQDHIVFVLYGKDKESTLASQRLVDLASKVRRSTAASDDLKMHFIDGYHNHVSSVFGKQEFPGVMVTQAHTERERPLARVHNCQPNVQVTAVQLARALQMLVTHDRSKSTLNDAIRLLEKEEEDESLTEREKARKEKKRKAPKISKEERERREKAAEEAAAETRRRSHDDDDEESSEESSEEAEKGPRYQVNVTNDNDKDEV